VGADSALGGGLPAIGGAIGVALMAAGLLTARSRPVLWSVGLVAGSCVGSLYVRGLDFDPWSLLIGIGLLAASELAHWSIDCRVPALDEVRVHLIRAGWVTIALALGLALATVVESAALLGSSGTVVVVAATVAVVASLVTVAVMIWRGRPAEA
jgi:hypothetical protein